jgi:hypothetical protein
MNPKPRYSKEEFAARGDGLYERDIAPVVEKPENEGKFVAVDIETGDFEIDSDELTASNRLAARRPEGQIWLRRVGSRCTRRYGPRRSSVSR